MENTIFTLLADPWFQGILIMMPISYAVAYFISKKDRKETMKEVLRVNGCNNLAELQAVLDGKAKPEESP